MAFKLVSVTSDTQKKLFIDYPHELYKDDKFYVPEIYMAMSEHLSEKKNPFFKHSEAHLFLAYEDEKIVGRIATILNNNYNKFHDCRIAFFGFFDCINNQSVADLLLDKAMEFAKSKGATALHGPTNFNTNDTAGLLVEGFDSPPVVQMTYNFSYYKSLIEHYGFEKDMDMFAFWIPEVTVSEKSLNLSDRLKERLANKGITFRNVNMKKFKTEINGIKEIYREAWEKNWGFVPPTDEEFEFLAEGLKLIVDDRFVFICEDKGKMVGFAVALPDINEIMINVKRGRIFPFGIFKLLFGKKKTSKVRVLLLGVIEDYRKMGIEAVMYASLISNTRKFGKLGGEASWVLESNEMMVKGAENLNGQKYKTYRIYSKPV
jgi:GNAT superfamily N-acetyltransferase